MSHKDTPMKKEGTVTAVAVDDDSSLGTDRLTEKLSLSINDLTYEVGKKDKKKDILHNVSASFTSGELVAVMGPSGAGKTTFLNVLSNSRSSKQIRNGGVSLNGKPLPKGYNSLCSYIPQNDVLYPALTPRQAFMYAAQLRLPRATSHEEKVAVVEKLIKDLNLEKCADSVVGSENTRGISGGEKKRTSIGLELIVNPAIILVDEPTSGLDSKMAEDVVEMLQIIANDRGRLVLCTIHQPSWQVYQKFDKLTLLNHGHMVYHGSSDKVIDYFTTLDLKVPSFENPLDFYFRELQTRDGDFFSSSWQMLNDEQLQGYETQMTLDLKDDDLSSGEDLVKNWSSNDNTMFHQFRYIFTRASQDTLRDKEKFIQGLVMKLSIGVLLGIVFINQADGTNPGIFTANAALFFIVLSAAMDTTMKALLEYPIIKPLIVREYRNGAFQIFPYFMAQLLSNSLFDSLASLFYMPAYFMVGLRSDAGPVFYFIMVLTLLTVLGVLLGLLIGAQTADIKEAQGYFIPLIMPQLLFAGFLIPLDQIPDFFQWIYYTSFFQYGLSGALINEFADAEFSDCPPDDFALEPNCTAVLTCFTTGNQYLASLELEPSDLSRNIYIILLFIVGFIPLAYLSVYNAVKKGASKV